MLVLIERVDGAAEADQHLATHRVVVAGTEERSLRTHAAGAALPKSPPRASPGPVGVGMAAFLFPAEPGTTGRRRR